MSELHQVLAELEMCSHVSAVNLNPSIKDISEGDDIGGKRPTGGIDSREDRHRRELGDTDTERVLRSATHYRRQLARGRPAGFVLQDARASLEAWRRQPAPKNPVFGSPQWKRWIAESPKGHADLAREFGVSRQYIQQIRRQYLAA